jgi:hypothetical protein
MMSENILPTGLLAVFRHAAVSNFINGCFIIITALEKLIDLKNYVDFLIENYY